MTDTFQQMDHFYWSLQAWLMYRFDILSASSTLLLTLLALYIGLSPGLTAFVLVAASRCMCKSDPARWPFLDSETDRTLAVVSSTHSLCRQYGQLEMDFVSVERVVELLHLEQESSGTVRPPARWPSYTGDIVFEDVTIRYAPHLDPALSSLSFRIRAGSHTAIIGRTGTWEHRYWPDYSDAYLQARVKVHWHWHFWQQVSDRHQKRCPVLASQLILHVSRPRSRPYPH